MGKKKQEYESIAHAKTSLRYHIIFSTKYRQKCLDNIKEDVLLAFKEAENQSDFKILKINTDRDHVHLLMKWKPSLSISQVIRRLKQMTTSYLWKKQEQYLSTFFWKKHVLWTGGYFISTIGEISEEKIMEYIENQG
jgi:putative transposase